MRGIVTILVVVLVGVLGILLYLQSTLRQQTNEIRELNARVDSWGKPSAMDFQEKCARQAREEFKLSGLDKHEMAGMSNHYNARLNKCFVEIQDTDARTNRGTIVTSKTVSDARLRARFMQLTYGVPRKARSTGKFHL